jgi:hypothetical protein
MVMQKKKVTISATVTGLWQDFTASGLKVIQHNEELLLK